MKIAVLSAYAATPPIEGNSRRILNFTRALRALGHDVYFVLMPSGSLKNPDLDGHIREFGKGRFIRLEPDMLYKLLYLPKRVLGELKRRLLKFIGSDKQYYYGLDEFFPEEGRSRLKTLQDEIGAEAVVAEYVFHSAALKHFPADVMKVIDAHDCFADRHRQFNGANYFFSVPVKEQVRGFRRADVVVAIQEEEAEKFRNQIGARKPEVVAVSHLLDLDRKVNDYSPAGAVFLGSGNIANVESLKYFIVQVLPLIRRDIPDFRFHVAGSVCRKIEDAEGVIKLGIVDHVADAFAQAPISLNPMLHGTGINIKLLDALASGVVTVSTRTGVRGLPQAYRNGVAVVDDGDAAAFAAEVVSLARDEKLRRARGEAAFRDAIAWNDTQTNALAAIFTPSAAGHIPIAKLRAQG